MSEPPTTEPSPPPDVEPDPPALVLAEEHDAQTLVRALSTRLETDGRHALADLAAAFGAVIAAAERAPNR